MLKVNVFKRGLALLVSIAMLLGMAVHGGWAPIRVAACEWGFEDLDGDGICDMCGSGDMGEFPTCEMCGISLDLEFGNEDSDGDGICNMCEPTCEICGMPWEYGGICDTCSWRPEEQRCSWCGDYDRDGDSICDICERNVFDGPGCTCTDSMDIMAGVDCDGDGRCDACGGCLHNNIESATCTDPQYCLDCGVTYGEALGHRWTPATCTEPKKCSRCGLTEGEPLGHSWNSGICVRCGLMDESEFRGEAITVDSSFYPESDHDYASNSNESKVFTWEGAICLKITFSSSTATENNCDKIYLYNGDGDQIAVYTGTQAAGVTVLIPGDSFTVKLTSDYSVQKYGYSFSSIVAYMPEQELPTSGTCGDNLTWQLGDDGALTVSGTGAMDDFAASEAPWYGHKDTITSLVIEAGVTGIGANAFADCASLTDVYYGDNQTHWNRIAVADGNASLLEATIHFADSPCPDTDNDHKCDVCQEVLSGCSDGNSDHKCDVCGATLSQCADENNDHKCELCGATTSECVDADGDGDHNCDTCGKEDISECVDSDDHKCDVCGKVVSDCADPNRDHKCDVCQEVLSGCADGNSDHKCDVCGATLSQCADENNDHKCELCGATTSNCADADGDGDHNCDRCGKEKASNCSSNDGDHICDECGSIASGCSDAMADTDHNCDLCGKEDISQCVDSNYDHICDDCGELLSACADENNDHNCDVCQEALSECADANGDGNCDLCGRDMNAEPTDPENPEDPENPGNPEDPEEPKDPANPEPTEPVEEVRPTEPPVVNNPDISGFGDRPITSGNTGFQVTEGAEEIRLVFVPETTGYYTFTTNSGERIHGYLYDSAMNGLANDEESETDFVITKKLVAEQTYYIYMKYFGTRVGATFQLLVCACEDADMDHICDICDTLLEECADSAADDDHVCDYGCGMIRERCADTTNDHRCEICDKVVTGCEDTNGDKICDICGCRITKCQDYNNDHKCDDCGAVLTQCSDAEGDNDHNCDDCGKPRATKCADGNKDHKCDECGLVLGRCTDAAGDGDHICDVCGKDAASACADSDCDHHCDECGVELLTASGDCGEELSWKLYDNGDLIIVGAGAMAGSTGNATLWGEYFGSVQSVVVGDGLTAISGNAFYGCGNLTSIAIPNSVNTVGGSAFAECDGLETVVYCGTQREWNEIEIAEGNEALTNAELHLHNYEDDVCTICRGVACKHDWSAATCTESKTCALCQEIEGEPLGHNAGAAATCETAQTCTRCDYVFAEALGHDMQETSAAVTPGCETAGSTAGYTCANGCGKTEGGEVIPATGHSYVNNTCTVCKSCNISVLTFTLNSAGDGYIVSACDTAATGKLVIPATYNGLPVTEIARDAIKSCKRLTGVVIPSSVTAIGKYAFAYCVGLTEIVIPGSITTVSEGLFAYCTGIKTAVFQDGVTSVGSSLFFHCLGLTSVTIPDSVVKIEHSAFAGCDSMTEVIYCGAQKQWDAIAMKANNEPLTNAELQRHNYENGLCTICGQERYSFGDVDDDEIVDHEDAIYLLLHTMFGEECYPIHGADADVDGNGSVDHNDAIYLLLHSLFGDVFYPLKKD